MVAKLIKIIKGAQYESTIWDYWLFFQLQNDQVIKVFDQKNFASSMKENSNYDISLSSCMVFSEITFHSNVFHGNIIKLNMKKIFINKTLDIILTDSDDLKEVSDVSLTIGRIDLVKFEYIKPISKLQC